MAHLLDDFEAYFTGAGLATGVVYKDTIPDNPDTAIAIFEYAGSGGPAQVAGALRSIQIVSRALKVADARKKALELYASLVTEDGIINLTPERWGQINLRQTPFKMKVDEKGRNYYAFNLGITTYYD